eukprot:scaffold44014_cov32-Phaeocystis_antarctica.AAC.1
MKRSITNSDVHGDEGVKGVNNARCRVESRIPLMLDAHFNILLSSNRRETATSRCPTRRPCRCPRRSRCCCRAGRGRAGRACEQPAPSRLARTAHPGPQ